MREPTLVMSDWLLCPMVVSDWLLGNRRSVIGHSEGQALYAGGASVEPALNLLNQQWSKVSGVGSAASRTRSEFFTAGETFKRD